MRKRFANSVNRYGNVLEVEHRIKSICNQDFKGDIYLNNYLKVLEPHFLDKGLCIQDNNYKWLKFFDYDSQIQLTAVYDEKEKIVEWYFDIAKSIGKENGIPYEDDFYLDVVLTPEGKVILLDEDEFEEAFKRNEMTKKEYNQGYKIAYELMENLVGNVDKVLEFTDKYLKEIL